METQLASILKDLADRKYQVAKTKTTALRALVSEQHTSLLASFITPTAVPSKTVPKKVVDPSQQQVSTSIGTFTVTAITGDMGSTRIIVDTASDHDCKNDCPVLSLADYVARNGAYAGINGAYFCPSTYPQCSDKKNSFDTLLMNKNKTYFNSENNVYSTVPAVIFGNGFMRFVTRSLEWGRDTSVDSVIANQPLLVSGGTVVFGGDGDPKKGSKGPRSFVGNKGNTAYIGVVFNATVAEAAVVLKAMGLENALNLDSGGSTALWSGGYKVGPGRNLPNAILFVRK
jgi:exopolysaccharide biosynthesis protein